MFLQQNQEKHKLKYKTNPKLFEHAFLHFWR